MRLIITEDQLKTLSINLHEWGGKKRYYGGNSGYVGFSKSRRAVDAEDRGLKNKSQMDNYFVGEIKDYVKSKTGEDIKISLALIKRELTNMKADEWHHTSKYGNRTDYYSVETIGNYFIDRMGLEKNEQPEPSTTSSIYNTDYLRAMANDNNEIPSYQQSQLNNDGYILDLYVEPGRKVEHQRFGQGVVTDVLDAGNVYVVDFDEYGEKKLLKRFARLKIIENVLINEDYKTIDGRFYFDRTTNDSFPKRNADYMRENSLYWYDFNEFGDVIITRYSNHWSEYRLKPYKLRDKINDIKTTDITVPGSYTLKWGINKPIGDWYNIISFNDYELRNIIKSDEKRYIWSQFRGFNRISNIIDIGRDPLKIIDNMKMCGTCVVKREHVLSSNSIRKLLGTNVLKILQQKKF